MTNVRSGGRPLQMLTALLLVISSVITVAASGTPVYAASQGQGKSHKPVCAPAAAHRMRCTADVVTGPNGNPIIYTTVSGNGLPGGSGVMGPAQFHTAYNLPCSVGGTTPQSSCPTPASFGGQTIGIVDAYDDPNAASDLAQFSTDAGIPPCTIANGCFRKVAQDGTTNYPPYNSDWAVEEKLDVQVAHEICQTCKILLVEARSASTTDLGTAVNEAVALGATEVSNSYGGDEFGTSDDHYWVHPGVAVTASTGDYGYGVSAPSTIPQVVAVGGTSLSLNSNNTYNHESAWNGAGSGCSGVETASAWQTALSNWAAVGCGTHRSVADVSADADPNTGAIIYCSQCGGYEQIGGTSLSSPLIAAVFALAGGISSGTTAASQIPYSDGTASNLHDVTTGANGGCSHTPQCTAGAGYDGPTGLGTPNGVTAFGAARTDQTITVTTHAPSTAVYHTTFTVAATASSGLSVSYGSSGACSNSGATFTMTSGTGTCTVTYNQAGDGNHNPAPEVTETVTAQKADQSITFGPLADQPFGTAPFTVSATASSGLGVSFSVGSTDQCTISATTVTLTGVGSCTVTADQGGDNNYNAAPGMPRSFKITPGAASITLDQSSLSATYDGSPHLATATTSPSGLHYSVSYTDTNNAPVSSPTNAGSYGVTATITDPNYQGSTTGTLVINKADQTITVTTPAPSTAVYNTTFTVAATASSGLNVSYGSSGACSNSGATFTMTSGTGTCTVTYDQAGDGNHNPAPEVTETVTAQKADQTVTFGALSDATYPGAAFSVNATPGASGNTVTFTAGPNTVCTSSGTAGSTITPVGVGTCTVTANELGNANYNDAPPVPQSFKVKPAPATVKPTAGDASPVKVGTAGGTASVPLSATLSASVGNLTTATVTFLLTPLMGSSTTTYSCTASPTTSSTTAPVSVGCTVTTVPVGVYTLTLSVGGNYTTGPGSQSGVVTVDDPSLGYTFAGGTVSHSESSGVVPVAFGLMAKIVSGQVQGVWFAVEHRASGDVVLQSTSLSSLTIVPGTGTQKTANLLGSATDGGVSGYTFAVRAVDADSTGTSSNPDQYGEQVKDATGTLIPDLSYNPVALTSGDIHVP